MEQCKLDIMNTYGPNGTCRPGSWKKDSDKLFSPKDALTVWETLDTLGLIPPKNNNLIFVSPSANLPTHEMAIFQKESQGRTGKTIFLAGDLLPIHQSRADGYLNHRTIFQYIRWDAEHLPLALETVDVVWDRKGWIWHCANLNDPIRLDHALLNYHRILKTGGCLILDNIPDVNIILYRESLSLSERIEMSITRKLSRCIGRAIFSPHQYLPGKIPGQYERSTVGKMSLCNPNIWRELGGFFSISDIGQGVHSSRILIKK